MGAENTVHRKHFNNRAQIQEAISDKREFIQYCKERIISLRDLNTFENYTEFQSVWEDMMQGLQELTVLEILDSSDTKF